MIRRLSHSRPDGSTTRVGVTRRSPFMGMEEVLRQWWWMSVTQPWVALTTLLMHQRLCGKP
ncbi:hypothetical protein Ahy_A02g006481 isoform B [Arachis hypogaea]|uniref:Uncharacterized protein n=1 Tax=Arachis hypogaea TaxID=3818 RepID=A0A445E9T7_ARAHY|nr:hypothetical protein Ahy_A02g006481 isoform B [Arachis hypogaea]